MRTNKILVCDVGGTPHHWASWQDGVTLKYKDLLSYEIGDPSVFHGGMSRMTGERSQVDVGQIVFLKETLKYDARIPPLTNANLFARDLNICGYCGRHFVVSKLSRDHIVPTSGGGGNTWTNTVTACKPCNHMKADVPLGKARDEDGDLMQLLYVPYVPSHAERLILGSRHVLFDQMEYLKQFLPKHSRILQANTILGITESDVTEEDIIEEKVNKHNRHFYSGKELSAMKHATDIENSKAKRK